MSTLNVDKVDPSTGTTLELGTSGDTVSLPSGATLDISASTLPPPATMPASSGINFTALNATNLGSGTVPTARLGTGTASSSTVLYGDQTYKAEPGGNNTPVFRVYLASNQSITDVTLAKITFDTESIDSDGAFASNKFTVPVGGAGKYWFSTGIGVDSGGVGSFRNGTIYIYKNGANVQTSYFHNDNASAYTTKFFIWDSAILDLAEADYIEVYVYHDNAGGTPVITGGVTASFFGGFKLL